MTYQRHVINSISTNQEARPLLSLTAYKVNRIYYGSTVYGSNTRNYLTSWSKAKTQAHKYKIIFNTRIIDNPRIERIKKLKRIAALPDNWNGNGAKAFSKSLIDKVDNLVLNLLITPEVFPTAENSIQLEYDKADKSHLEIEIFEDRAEIYEVDSAGNESYEKVAPDLRSIDKVVAAFYG